MYIYIYICMYVRIYIFINLYMYIYRALRRPAVPHSTNSRLPLRKATSATQPTALALSSTRGTRYCAPPPPLACRYVCMHISTYRYVCMHISAYTAL